MANHNASEIDVSDKTEIKHHISRPFGSLQRIDLIAQPVHRWEEQTK